MLNADEESMLVMKDPADNPEPFTHIPIGIVRSPFSDITGMPIQPTGARGVRGSIEIRLEFINGLKDLEGFSPVILINAFHRCNGCSPEVKPFPDPTPMAFLRRGHPNGQMPWAVDREACGYCG